MKKIILHTHVVLFLALFCSCGTQQKKSVAKIDTIEFDYARDYPKSELTLSDLADIEYVALSAEDGFLASGNINNNGHNFHITPTDIFYNDNDVILVFDRTGKGKYKIDKKGKGPEEYVSIMDFCINSDASELFILDPMSKKIYVYDTKGNFKRNFGIPENVKAWQMLLLNDSTLITGSFPFMPAKYAAISSTDGRILQEFNTANDKNMEFDTNGMLAYRTLFPVSDGCILLADQNSRTKYIVDNNLNLSPYVTDNFLYAKNEVSLHPAIETDKYQLFYLLFSYFATPDLKPTAYIYDKQTKQMSIVPTKKSGESSVLYGDCVIINRFATQTRNIAVQSYSAVNVLSMNEKGQIDGKLKEIAATLKEDDNPVLMIMTFK